MGLTAKRVRELVAALPGTQESAHHGHPDFRVNGRIFATLHPDNKYGMVKLTPAVQQTFVRENPSSFTPENGAWGRQGCTRVQLTAVDEDTLGEAMTLAWQDAVKKRAAGRSKTKRPASPRRPSRKR